LLKDRSCCHTKGILQVRLSHGGRVVAARFDEPNLVSAAGLVPVMRLAGDAGLGTLAGELLTVPGDKGANAGGKVTALVAGMVAGADSIDDMALLRHGAMGTLFDQPYAPSTLGSFLRAFAFGHVRQLDAVASRLLAGLAARTPLLAGLDEGLVCVDVDDMVIEVHGYAKQGAGFGYSGVRGLNALLATVTTGPAAPVVVAQRLRKGSANSARGAKRLVRDALAAVRSLRPAGAASRVLLRADSAFYGHATIGAAVRAGAQVSVTVRMDPKVRAAIAAIADDAWTPIAYPDAIYDQESGRWISRAEVAEVPFTAFSSRPQAGQLAGRLVVRRIPDFNRPASPGQASLFQLWRFHAFFTTSDLGTVAADSTHRGHAIIEQVNADLKNSALAHLPSGRFTANSAWLVCAVMAFNLTRAAATIAGGRLAKATTATIRRTLVTVPARIASSGRRLTLHLPIAWPWQQAWTGMFTRACGPPRPAAS
jgi:Transposase DDE domain group 1